MLVQLPASVRKGDNVRFEVGGVQVASLSRPLNSSAMFGADTRIPYAMSGIYKDMIRDFPGADAQYKKSMIQRPMVCGYGHVGMRLSGV